MRQTKTSANAESACGNGFARWVGYAHAERDGLESIRSEGLDEGTRYTARAQRARRERETAEMLVDRCKNRVSLIKQHSE